MANVVKEYNLSTDDFKQPKITTGRKAIAMLLVRLLLLEPGTNPNRPEMGVGLVSKYRYMFPDNLPELKADIYNQMNRYLVPYQKVEVTLDVKDSSLCIEITVDDSVYKYVTEEQENNKITLTELIEEV